MESLKILGILILVAIIAVLLYVAAFIVILFLPIVLSLIMVLVAAYFEIYEAIVWIIIAGFILQFFWGRSGGWLDQIKKELEYRKKR